MVVLSNNSAYIVSISALSPSGVPLDRPNLNLTSDLTPEQGREHSFLIITSAQNNHIRLLHESIRSDMSIHSAKQCVTQGSVVRLLVAQRLKESLDPRIQFFFSLLTMTRGSICSNCPLLSLMRIL